MSIHLPMDSQSRRLSTPSCHFSNKQMKIIDDNVLQKSVPIEFSIKFMKDGRNNRFDLSLRKLSMTNSTGGTLQVIFVHHVHSKFATPILHVIDKLKNNEIFSSYT